MAAAPERAPVETAAADVDWRPSCDIDTLLARAAALADVRAFFAEHGVLEADTPVLGAATVTDPAIESLRVTASDGSGRAWFLQTSPEFHMKRLLAAGAPSIYRLGPVFRADEHGRLHNPEFTMIEWYRIGFDLSQLIGEVTALVERLAGPAPTEIVTYRALIARRFGVDPLAAPRDALVRAAVALDAPPAKPAVLDDRGLLDLLFAAAIDDLGVGRVFVTEFPAAQAALARCRPDDDGRLVAERFELIVDGVEIANGYDELLDAAELEARMARDEAQRRATGAAVPDRDRRLLSAMRHGLPSCAGVALGFDRLLLCGLRKPRLSGVVPFAIDRS
jgi:elongation factor P--(R)-beta-lysine ligase